MDWAELTQSIAAAARTSFSDLLAQNRGESFYAFILYTDADCYTILPSANSIEKHEETITRQGVNDSREVAGYQWSIGEWAYEAWKDEAFRPICEALSAASQSACEAGTFPDFRQRVHATMIEALASLDREGFFGSLREDLVLFISSSDYDESIGLENRSAQVLNPADVAAAFLTRYAV